MTPPPEAVPKPRKPRPARVRPERPAPSEIDQVEKRIEDLERQVGTLEAKLAADWSDMDVLASHRAAREELQAQLRRWEELFEAAQRADDAVAEPG